MKSLRNLLHVLSRFKMASFLNILGLSIAFASFSVIMMQVFYEQNYNHCHKNMDRIFRLEWSMGRDGTFAAIAPKPLSYAIQKSPHVQEMAFYSPAAIPQTLIVRDGDEERHFLQSIIEVSPSIIKIFSFDFIAGDTTALKTPYSVILPKSLADNYYHNIPAIGQMIEFEDTMRVVTGVYKDFPKNSTIGNNIYYSNSTDKEYDNWYNANNFAFFLFDTPESADNVLTDTAPFMKQDVFGCATTEELISKMGQILRFNNLEDLYYSNDVKYVFSETGSRQTTYILICVAIIIIIIAGINFTNFSTALTPMRIKGINTRKVLGSPVSTLRVSLISEGVYISFISFLLSLLIIFLCKGTFIEGFITPGIDFMESISILVMTAGISIVAGIIAGLYPSFYMTSFSPALVLKGSFGLSIKGRKIRTVLLCVQYIASISLLIVSTFMIMQNKHMFNTSFGYDKDQVLTVMVNENIHKSEDAFVNSLTNYDGIEYVGFSYVYLSCLDDTPNWGRELNGEHIQFYAFAATKDLLRALGIQITEGRDFLESDKHTPGGAFIFNQKAKEAFGMKIGDNIWGEVVGFMPDIVYSSFRRPIQPMAFGMFGEEGNWLGFPLNVCYIRIAKGTNYDAAVKHIKKTLTEYDPYSPFEVGNLDAEIENAYVHEKSISSLVSLFSIISIIISIVGIYGLVIFETEYKKKEIGVRKVFGSTTREIMVMFSTSYVKIIAICSAIAIPISYYFVSRWLGQFESQTPIYWWVFALAFLAITLITLATCSWQNYKAASSNPIDSVKGE